MFNVKFVALFVAFVGAFVVVVRCVENEKYSDKYDHIDVDLILGNQRQRNLYYKCFAYEGPCLTQDAKFFRDNLLEAISTNCDRCTEAQRINLDKISSYYSNHEPQKYMKIVSRTIARAKNH